MIESDALKGFTNTDSSSQGTPSTSKNTPAPSGTENQKFLESPSMFHNEYEVEEVTEPDKVTVHR